MSLITVRGIQKLVGKGNVFLYKHSHFPSFAPVGKSLLKVVLYVYICMYYIYTFTHRYAYLFVNQYMQMQYCSQHCAGRGFASSLRTSSNASSIYCASLILGTKVLWVCPDLTLPLQQRTALADRAECPLPCLGTFVSLAGWDQQPPCSDPPCLFSTRFVLWLKHKRRSIRVVLNLCPPQSFWAKSKEMHLKPSVPQFL